MQDVSMQIDQRGAQTDACRIAICIATCQRPAGLQAILASLDLIDLPEPAPSIEIIVVDNCPTDPATASLGDISALSRWPLRYEIEETAGVVAARNHLLGLVPSDASLVAFLDDDETVSAQWLVAILKTRTSTGANAVQGPVKPRFPDSSPNWVQAVDLYEVGPFKEGQLMSFAGTGNLLIEKDFIDLHALRFDMRFNETGGEDQFLCTQMLGLGGRIVASADAVVYETVPPSRVTIRWVLRRSHRIGNTLGRIAVIRRRGRVLRAAKGVGGMLVGALTAATAGLVSSEFRIRGLARLARGSGMVMAFLGSAFVSEKPST